MYSSVPYLYIFLFNAIRFYFPAGKLSHLIGREKIVQSLQFTKWQLYNSVTGNPPLSCDTLQCAQLIFLLIKHQMILLINSEATPSVALQGLLTIYILAKQARRNMNQKKLSHIWKRNITRIVV